MYRIIGERQEGRGNEDSLIILEHTKYTSTCSIFCIIYSYQAKLHRIKSKSISEF